MRFALISLLILFVSCKDDGVYNGNYEVVASLLYSNNAKCEELALKYHDIAVKENDVMGVAGYSYLLGLVNSENDKYRVASDFLYNSIDKFTEIGNNESVAMCLYALGYLHNQYENYDLAKKCIDRALALNFNNEDLRFKLNHKMADACIGLGKKDTAFKIANSVLLKFPSIDEARKYRSIAYLNIKAQEYEKAIKYLNKSIGLDKNNNSIANCYLNLAYAYYKTNKPSISIEFINKALLLKNGKYSGEMLRTRALAYIQLKEYQKAASDLEKSLSFKINHQEITQGYNQISKGYDLLRDKSNSLLFAQKAIESFDNKERYMTERSKEAQSVREDILKHQYEKQLGAEQRARFYGYIMFALIAIGIGYAILSYLNKVNKIKISNEKLRKLASS